MNVQSSNSTSRPFPTDFLKHRRLIQSATNWEFHDVLSPNCSMNSPARLGYPASAALQSSMHSSVFANPISPSPQWLLNAGSTTCRRFIDSSRSRLACRPASTVPCRIGAINPESGTKLIPYETTENHRLPPMMRVSVPPNHSTQPLQIPILIGRQ